MSEPTTEAPTTATDAAPAPAASKPAPAKPSAADDDEDSDDEPAADAGDAEDDGDDAEPGLAYLYDNDVRSRLTLLSSDAAQKLPSDDEDEADFVADVEEPDVDEPEDEVRPSISRRADGAGRRR